MSGPFVVVVDKPKALSIFREALEAEKWKSQPGCFDVADAMAAIDRLLYEFDPNCLPPEKRP